MGFLTPLYLLALLSLAVLVWIYLRARSRPTLEVPSLILFDEVPAPVASVRFMRLDLMFFIEAAGLAALALTLAGMYVLTRMSAPGAPTRALVFDLGAAMGARDGAATRLDAARSRALQIVSAAAPGERFTVIGYALEARVVKAPTSDRAAVRRAIGGLRATAVATRPAALEAALIRARSAGRVDLFTDHPPSAATLDSAGGALAIHRIGAAEPNLAIVSLDPGTPHAAPGHCVVRSFATRPVLCELDVDVGGQSAFHRTLLMAPRDEATVAFGPLPRGGLVRARLVVADALAADNQRFAWAVGDHAERALVLSPDAGVRADLARVLLALNPNIVATVADPASYAAAAGAKPFDLAVMHDCYRPDVAARSRLLIFPPPGRAPDVAGLAVRGRLKTAALEESNTSGIPAAMLPLGAARALSVPEWMSASAHGIDARGRRVVLAAHGVGARGRLGVIAFDPRNHLLLDPDHMAALVTTLDLMRTLTAPRGVEIVSTGRWANVPAAGEVRITKPDGTTWLTRAVGGRARLRPMEAGEYRVESGAGAIALYANYYSSVESDLAPPASVMSRAGTGPAAPVPAERRPYALGPALLALALFLILLESALMVRRMTAPGARHV